MIKEHMPNLGNEDLELMAAKGYVVKSMVHIGFGNTRDVYRTKYSSGPFEEPRILKIPKRIKDVDSVTSLINLANLNVNENEVRCLQELNHPNIVRMLDCIPLSDGRLVNVEEDFDGVSLFDYVKMNGPLEDHLISVLMSQVFDGLIYLAAEDDFSGMGYFHRDIKPSNILINQKKKLAKITDLQNSGRISELEQKTMMTKGGTAFTHPNILNSFFNGGACATSESEAYSLALAIYFAKTGKLPFDYELKHDPDGFPVNIAGKMHYISLFSGGERINDITDEFHNAQVSRAVSGFDIDEMVFFQKAFTINHGSETSKHLSSSFRNFSDMKSYVKGVFKENASGSVAWNWKKSLLYTSLVIAFLGFGYVGLKTHFVNVSDNARIKKLYMEQTAADQYKQIFTQSFFLAKRALKEGQVDNSLSIDDVLIDEKAKEYGFEPELVRNILKTNKFYADGIYTSRQTTTSLVVDRLPGIELFDPFIVHSPGSLTPAASPIVDQGMNLDLGLKRLDGLRNKLGGDVMVALKYFYNPIESYDNAISDEKFMLGKQISKDQQVIIKNLAELLAYNANKHGYRLDESQGGMIGTIIYVGLEDPASHRLVLSPSRDLQQGKNF